MERQLMQELERWRGASPHLPLLLRGARQVGKTYLVREFGARSFEDFVEVNFELAPEYVACFETLKPNEIISRIEMLADKNIVQGKTLLFLDEIQACPNAIAALRYFKEMLPDLHVIGAGSLLEFALHQEDMRMPVGRIQYLYMKPLSFQEYLTAKKHGNLINFIKTICLGDTIPSEIHERLLGLVREYMNVGGMPMVVERYLSTQSLRDCQNYQTLILRTFNDDFAKYAPSKNHKYLQLVFNKAPGMVGKQIKYSTISSEVQSVYLKGAIDDLRKAGVTLPIYATSGAGLPLNTYINEKKYKILFLDVGLVKRATKLDMALLFEDDLMLLNQGAIAEQFVGQELLAYQDPFDEALLYYWAREEKSSTAEIDYLININRAIIPIEVKSGKTGSLKSLQLFMKEYRSQVGVRISGQEFSKYENIVSIPFYLISELARFVGEDVG